MTLSSIDCPGCGEKNERNVDICISCGHSLGFVNVNIYSDGYFQDEIEKRYSWVLATVADKKDDLRQFEAILTLEGKALINLNFKMLCRLVIDKDDYLPYRTAVEQGRRDKSAFLNDKDRCLVEAAFYGIDGGKIVYAVLSLDDNGLLNYGKMTVTLKTRNIEHRTTVFERNTYNLFDEFVDKGWKVTGPIPAGHSTIWEHRGKLAVCKHGTEIVTSNPIPDFAALILKSGTDRDKDEFIELHIFNKVNRLAIDQITIHEQPKTKFEQLQLDILKIEADTIGITITQK